MPCATAHCLTGHPHGIAEYLLLALFHNKKGKEGLHSRASEPNVIPSLFLSNPAPVH